MSVIINFHYSLKEISSLLRLDHRHYSTSFILRYSLRKMVLVVHLVCIGVLLNSVFRGDFKLARGELYKSIYMISTLNFISCEADVLVKTTWHLPIV